MMFCRFCYADLASAPSHTCPRCNKPFTPTDANTFLSRPFPRWRKLLLQLVLTTCIAVIVALAVSFHQTVRDAMNYEPLRPHGH